MRCYREHSVGRAAASASGRCDRTKCVGTTWFICGTTNRIHYALPPSISLSLTWFIGDRHYPPASRELPTIYDPPPLAYYRGHCAIADGCSNALRQFFQYLFHACACQGRATLNYYRRRSTNRLPLASCLPQWRHRLEEQVTTKITSCK